MFLCWLVGHPKSFVSGEGLEYLLKKTQENYIFDSISNCLKSCKIYKKTES